MLSILILLPFTAIVASLIWARFRFFKIESSKARLGSLLYDPAVAVHILGVYYYVLYGQYTPLIPTTLAIIFYILALAFFWWAIRTAKHLEFALSSRVGKIITNGPFSFVRHPFYSSYIVVWVTSSLLFNSLWLWIALTYLVSFYFVSARSEEKMILNSANSIEYSAYYKKNWYVSTEDKTMENLTFKTITSTSETELFLDKVESYSGVRLPSPYVENSEIVGVFLQKRMVAGYMLVTKPGFRSLLFVPDAVKKSHDFFNNDDYEMMEVNGLWISPAVKTPKLQYKIWIRLIKDIFMSKKKYLLLMSDSRNKTIEALHNLTNPEILYRGQPQLLGCEKSHTNIRVGFTTRWNILFNVPKYWLELRSRQKRAAQTSRQRAYARTIKTSSAHMA